MADNKLRGAVSIARRIDDSIEELTTVADGLTVHGQDIDATFTQIEIKSVQHQLGRLARVTRALRTRLEDRMKRHDDRQAPTGEA